MKCNVEENDNVGQVDPKYTFKGLNTDLMLTYHQKYIEQTRPGLERGGNTNNDVNHL